MRTVCEKNKNIRSRACPVICFELLFLAVPIVSLVCLGLAVYGVMVPIAFVMGWTL